MNSIKKVEFKIDKNEVTKKYTCSSGNGGQNVNRIQSCVQLTHKPTGIQVKCQDTRDQYKNEVIAWERLTNKLKIIEDDKKYHKHKNFRNNQIGNGSRGGTKRRTYRILENIVYDHITGKKCRWKDILKGKIELLS